MTSNVQRNYSSQTANITASMFKPMPSSFASYLETLNNKGSTASERLLEPTHIHVMGNVASLTSHYKFFVNDKFSHCGDEVFTFVRNGEKWVITGSVFTVDKSDSCS